MKRNLKILIANDDGIHSPGIALLARAASAFGEVYVVAPAGQCSGMSVKLTIDPAAQMALRPYDFPVPGCKAWSLDGTPADCVKVALRYLLDFKPDVVLSGINDGMNAGLDVNYSGTIGAATEAALNGIPAIAFSNQDAGSSEVAAHYLGALLEELLEKPLGWGEIWNVNFPTCPLSACRGVQRGRTLEPHSYYENFFRCAREEDGVRYLSPAASILRLEDTAPESDLRAVLSGYVSVGKVLCIAH